MRKATTKADAVQACVRPIKFKPILVDGVYQWKSDSGYPEDRNSKQTIQDDNCGTEPIIGRHKAAATADSGLSANHSSQHGTAKRGKQASRKASTQVRPVSGKPEKGLSASNHNLNTNYDGIRNLFALDDMGMAVEKGKTDGCSKNGTKGTKTAKKGNSTNHNLNTNQNEGNKSPRKGTAGKRAKAVGIVPPSADFGTGTGQRANQVPTGIDSRLQEEGEVAGVGGVKYNAPPFDNTQKALPTFRTQERLLINVDWLSYRMTERLNVGLFVNDVWETGIYSFRLLAGGTSIYNYRADVFADWPFHTDKKKIGTIAWDARLPIHKGTMSYKIENWLFYDDYNIGTCFTDCANCLAVALGADVLNISRLDIAIDGVDFHPLLEGLLHGSKYLHKGTKSISRKDVCPYTNQLQYFYVGNREGAKSCVYYNKSREIREKSNKQYIVEHWKQNGFDTEKDVWRFEIRLTSEAINCIQEMRIFDDHFIKDTDNNNRRIAYFSNPAVLASIFSFHLRNWFEFVPSHGTDSVTSRREPVTIIAWNEFKAQKYTRVGAYTGESQRTAKIVAKKMTIEAAGTQEAPLYRAYMKTVMDIIEKNSLRQWYKEKNFFILNDVDKHLAKTGRKYNKDMDRLKKGRETLLNVLDRNVKVKKESSPFGVVTVIPMDNNQNIDFS